MNKNRTALQELAVGLALAVMPMGTQAGVIIQTAPIGFSGELSPFEIPGAPPLPNAPFNGALPLPASEATFGQFDTPGTLNSATWRVSGVMDFHYSHHAEALVVKTLPLTPYAFGLVAGGTLTLSLGLAGVNSLDSLFIATGGPTAENCSGLVSIPLPAIAAVVECDAASSGRLTIDASFTITGSDLAEFMGAGDIEVPYFPIAAWTSVPPAIGPVPLPSPVSFVTGSFEGEGTLELTYDFTPGARQVPLPATSLLVGVGLLGLAIARKMERT